MNFIVIVSIFVICLFLMETFRHAYINITRPELKTVRKRLKRLPSIAYESDDVDILRRRRYSDMAWLNSLLGAMPGIRKLDDLILQANLEYSIGFFLLLTPLLAVFGYFAGHALTKGGEIVPVSIALVLGYAPFAWVRQKKKARMQAFEKQLPDALELIARTLRAGQPFAGGMSIACEEFNDPIGTEFQRTLDEINFGFSVQDALKNLAARVDCPDLSFFVVAVAIQRESGGNLAEIIENIAHVIRERFKLFGKIRILTAEGKFSAAILCLLPFMMALLLFVVNRNYFVPFMEDPTGKKIILAGFVMMLLGVLVMRRIIRIKV
ncbi:MAG: type II secretion system F family protein [Syntrophobacteraceae bacterium]|nr:type II secretion system F family protein [Syntrophobacteraceae bacterium]